MNNIRLAITLLNHLRPVGPVSERDHALLTDRLVRELGSDYANFLAEPIPSGNGAQVDWYVNATSRPRPMEELDPQAKSALLSAAESRKMSVNTLADRLEQGSRGDKEIAKALRNAMITPDSGWLYDVDGKPVLVGWGYVSAQNEQRGMGLTGVGGMPASAATGSVAAQAVQDAEQISQTPPTSPRNSTTHSSQTHNVDHVVHTTTYHHNNVIAATPFNWRSLLFWLLFALLALIFIWLLLSSSALNRWSTVVSGPKVEIGSAHDPDLQKIADLNKEIAALEGEARNKQQACNEQQAQNNRPENDPSRADSGRNPFESNQPEQRADRGNGRSAGNGESGSNGGANNGQPNITIIMPQNGGSAPDQRVEVVPVPIQVPEAPTQQAPTQPTPTQPTPEQPEPAQPPETPSEPEQPQTPEPQTERQRELDDVINRAGVKTGALQITLIWKGKADLDLSIRCPNGTRVYFKRRSSCGATLDRDANRRPDMISREPVENIYWSDPSQIPPKIPVYVDYYDNHGDPRPNTPFRLRIRKTIIDPQTGQSKVEDKIIDGVANGSNRQNPRQIYVITNP